MIRCRSYFPIFFLSSVIVVSSFLGLRKFAVGCESVYDRRQDTRQSCTRDCRWNTGAIGELIYAVPPTSFSTSSGAIG
jgi:hypothetical protein